MVVFIVVRLSVIEICLLGLAAPHQPSPARALLAKTPHLPGRLRPAAIQFLKNAIFFSCVQRGQLTVLCFLRDLSCLLPFSHSPTQSRPWRFRHCQKRGAVDENKHYPKFRRWSGRKKAQKTQKQSF